jgi:hypothetical protein
LLIHRMVAVAYCGLSHLCNQGPRVTHQQKL